MLDSSVSSKAPLAASSNAAREIPLRSLHGGHGAGSVRSSSSDGGAEGLRARSKIEVALQGVLYSMVRGNTSGALLAWIVMGADFFQLFVFAFDIDIPWNFPFLFSGRQTAGLLFGTYAWLVVFVACFLFVLGVYANVIYVARSFLRGHFKMIWPLKTLRTFITTIITIGYIPILKAMVPPLNCENGALVEFPDVKCSAATVLVVVTVVAYAALVPLCLLMAVVYHDQNPLSTNILARHTGRVDALFLFWKTILTLVFVLTHVLYLKPVLLMLCCGSIIYYTLKLLPYYHVNALRTMIAMHTFFFILAAFGTIISAFNPPTGGSPWYTVVAIGIAIPAGIAAAYGAGRYAVAVKDRVERSIPELITLESSKVPLGAKANPRAFGAAEHLPSCARGFYALPVTSEVITRLRHVHERALAEYPNSPLVFMSMSQFLLQVTNDPGRALTYVRKAATMNPAWDVRFAIHCLERDIQQNIEAKNVGGQDSVDVVTYIQFQKSMTEATFYHRETLKHLIDFWSRLEQGEADYVHFPQIIHQIATAEAKAEESYKMLLKHFPNSRSLVLSYARFLEFGKNDRAAAGHYYDLAEQLENGYNNKEDRSTDLDNSRKDGGQSQSDRLDWTTGTQAGGEQTFRQVLTKRRSPAAGQVRNALLKAFPLAFILFCCFFGVMRAQLDQRMTAILVSDAIVSNSYDSSLAMALVRRMQTSAQIGDPKGYALNAGKLVTLTDQMESTMRTVFEEVFGSRTNGNSVIDNYMTNNSVKIPYVTSAPWENVTVGTATLAFVDSLEYTFSRMRSIGLMDMSLMQSDSLIVDPDFRAVLESRKQAQSVLDANDFIADQLSGIAESVSITFIVVWAALAWAGVASICLLARLRISPALKLVEAERTRAIDLFQEIPRNVVHELHSKLKQAYATEGSREVNGRHKRRTEESAAARDSTSAAGSDEKSLLLQTKINFLIIVLLVAAIFISSGYYVLSTRYDSALYCQLGHAKKLLAQLGFMAMEMGTRQNMTVWTVPERRALVGSLSDKFLSEVYGLSSPNSLGGSSYIQRFPATDALINGDGGLMESAQKFSTICAQLAALDIDADAVLNSPPFMALINVLNSGSMRGLFNTVLQVSRDSASAAKTVAVNVSTALFILMLIAFAWLGFVNIRALVRLLHDEGRRTYGMLLMIPHNVATDIPAIHDFITQSHRWTQETFRPEEAAAVVGITADGVIMSCERTQALGFADDRELIGRMVTSLLPTSLGHVQKGKREVTGLAHKIKPFMLHKLTRVVTGAHGQPQRFAIGAMAVEENRVRYKLLLFTPRDYLGSNMDAANADNAAPAELALAQLDIDMRLKMTREIMMWSRDAMVLVDGMGVIRDANLSAARVCKKEIRGLIGSHIETVVPSVGAAASLSAGVKNFLISGQDTNPEVFMGKAVEITTSHGTEKVSMVVRHLGEKGYLFFFDYALVNAL